MTEFATDRNRPTDKGVRAVVAPSRAMAAAQAERQRIASVRAALAA